MLDTKSFRRLILKKEWGEGWKRIRVGIRSESNREKGEIGRW